MDQPRFLESSAQKKNIVLIVVCDQVTKEVGRLRNAFVVDCRL